MGAGDGCGLHRQIGQIEVGLAAFVHSRAGDQMVSPVLDVANRHLRDPLRLLQPLIGAFHRRPTDRGG